MGTFAVLEREIRCECHRLLMRISSTSSAWLQVKCPRCRKVTAFQVHCEHRNGHGHS